MMKYMLGLLSSVAIGAMSGCGDGAKDVSGSGNGHTGDAGAGEGGSTASGTGGSSRADAGGGGAAPDLCAPGSNDKVCGACVKGSCCDQAKACAGDTPCACTVNCLAKGEDPEKCATDCKNDPLDDATTAFGSCVTDSCGMQCGG